jgi:hypothetical protein
MGSGKGLLKNLWKRKSQGNAINIPKDGIGPEGLAQLIVNPPRHLNAIGASVREKNGGHSSFPIGSETFVSYAYHNGIKPLRFLSVQYVSVPKFFLDIQRFFGQPMEMRQGHAILIFCLGNSLGFAIIIEL